MMALSGEIIMRQLIGAAACLLLTANTAWAVQVRNCDATAHPGNIVEPWEQNAKAFYKGDVRIALLDTGEPACCSKHLLVLTPDAEDPTGGRSCHLVSDHDAAGFNGIDFARITTSYDAKKGLLVVFPYSRMTDDGAGSKHATGKIRINLASGKVTAE
jgi:hypothetical protein